jgi:hypothetical protein
MNDKSQILHYNQTVFEMIKLVPKVAGIFKHSWEIISLIKFFSLVMKETILQDGEVL